MGRSARMKSTIILAIVLLDGLEPTVRTTFICVLRLLARTEEPVSVESTHTLALVPLVTLEQTVMPTCRNVHLVPVKTEEPVHLPTTLILVDVPLVLTEQTARTTSEYVRPLLPARTEQHALIWLEITFVLVSLVTTTRIAVW